MVEVGAATVGPGIGDLGAYWGRGCPGVEGVEGGPIELCFWLSPSAPEVVGCLLVLTCAGGLPRLSRGVGAGLCYAGAGGQSVLGSLIVVCD